MESGRLSQGCPQVHCVAGRWLGPERLLHREVCMKSLGRWCRRLLRDERGGEVLEYALIAGLIIVAAIVTISAVGGKLLAKWQSLNSSM